MLTHRSQKLTSLHQQLEAYLTEADKERCKLEQEKTNLKEKEEKMRKSLQAEFDKKEVKQRKMFDEKQKELQRKCDILEAEKRDWEEEKERVKQTKVFEKVVTLDVGGTKYRTTLSTLTKYPDSMLGAMFSGRHDLPQQEDGSYFIDRDGGDAFSYLMTYLRDRDLCFAICHDGHDAPDDLEPVAPVLHTARGKPIVPVKKDGVPHQLTSEARRLCTKVVYEARYFQLRELETKMQLLLKGYPEWKGSTEYRQTVYIGYVTADTEKGCKLDYGASYLKYPRSCPHTNFISLHRVTDRFFSPISGEGIEYQGKISFDSCDLSGMHFRNCYFQKGVSFEGCILHGTKFERVGGLVRHKVHFAPWQVAQADFEPELLQALKDNGCIY